MTPLSCYGALSSLFFLKKLKMREVGIPVSCHGALKSLIFRVKIKSKEVNAFPRLPWSSKLPFFLEKTENEGSW